MSSIRINTKIDLINMFNNLSINNVIGWSNHWKYGYISIDDYFIIRGWEANNIIDKSILLSETKNITVKKAIILIINSLGV